MVHYIRFLRTPQVGKVSQKKIPVTAVVTVVTDLGDTYLSADAELVSRLVDATGSSAILLTQTMQWQNGMRAVKISIPCNLKFASRLVRLHITTQNTIAALAEYRVADVLDVWSEKFHLDQDVHTDAIVERQLLLSNKCTVGMWEETGDSIARHIWDASLGFVLLFQQIISGLESSSLTSLQNLLVDQSTKKLNVLEVGAGCGIVGIALAQLRKTNMLLTDLEEAQSILKSNIGSATPLAGSTIRCMVLSWGSRLDALSGHKYDLILVSDCIYNPDSSILLVKTLKQFSDLNADTLILVGFKRRHDADEMFFEKMAETGFVVTESCDIMLPHTMTEYDLAVPQVEMFVFRTAK